jgi:hypothetical protein
VLSNVPPEGADCPESVTAWLGNSPSLCKPEIFHRRWRTDLDPTQHLAKYSLAPAPVSATNTQCFLSLNYVYTEIPQAAHSTPRNAQAKEKAILTVPDMIARCNSALQFFSNLDPQQCQQALVRVQPFVTQMESVRSRFELDVKIAKTQQVYCMLCGPCTWCCSSLLL